MDELSQNVIHLHVDKKAKMPKVLAGYEYKYANGHVEVHVAKKDQNTALKKLLDVLEKKKITVNNFSIEEERLENIFRRLVHG